MCIRDSSSGISIWPFGFNKANKQHLKRNTVNYEHVTRRCKTHTDNTRGKFFTYITHNTISFCTYYTAKKLVDWPYNLFNSLHSGRSKPCRYVSSKPVFEVTQPIRCHLMAFLLLIRYVILWPWPLILWPLTLDLWPLTFMVYQLSIVKLCAKLLSAIEQYAAVIAIWIFDLMTLNIFDMFCYALG